MFYCLFWFVGVFLLLKARPPGLPLRAVSGRCAGCVPMKSATFAAKVEKTFHLHKTILKIFLF